jgi:type IV pilus assembly protein PilB
VAWLPPSQPVVGSRGVPPTVRAPRWRLQAGAELADIPQVKSPIHGAVPASPVKASPRHERTMRRRLGEVLVTRGVLTEEVLDELLAEQAATSPEPGLPRRRLGQMVVDRDLGTETEVAEALADLLALDVVDLSSEPVDPTTVRLIPRGMAERFQLLVLARDDTGLRVAAADPTNVLALDDVRIHTRERSLHVVVATPSQIRGHLTRAWSLADDAADAVHLLAVDDDEDDGSSGDVDQTPTVRLLDALLGDAVRTGASDVHIEPQRDGVRIRYRVDGVLRDVMTVPRTAGPAMASRLKIISGLDIAERRVPQDGRTRISVDDRTIDARVSSLPAIHGEKIVIRLLTLADHVPSLDELGLSRSQFHVVQSTLRRPQGLVLITGPTGSGKTNTLYAAINQVITPESNVVTLEDPVEVQLPGITQVQINERTGMTFARGLKAVLRQDPDVVLVGEIRDLETAELAMRAALTGHLVLSTLHTNNAIQAVTRLIDMGIPPYLVASSLELVIAQRLIRVNCQSCATRYEPGADVVESLGLHPAELSGATPKQGEGCVECGETGYRGRVGVFEVLAMSPDARHAFVADPTEATLAEAASLVDGRSLREAGVAAAAEGRTTYAEALRVTHADAYREF